MCPAHPNNLSHSFRTPCVGRRADRCTECTYLQRSAEGICLQESSDPPESPGLQAKQPSHILQADNHCPSNRFIAVLSDFDLMSDGAGVGSTSSLTEMP